MAFREFATAAFHSPATALSWLTDVVFGSYPHTADGEINDVYASDEPDEYKGLLGLSLNGVRIIGKVIADFVYSHKTAIATAFWSSLAIAGAVALTLFLWPAALTVVATFTIAGLSIAGVVGANVIAQIIVAAALAAAATSVAVYATAAVVNTIIGIKNFFKGCFSKEKGSQFSQQHNQDNYNRGPEHLKILGGSLSGWSEELKKHDGDEIVETNNNSHEPSVTAESDDKHVDHSEHHDSSAPNL